ncbi:MAG: DUF1289 domain-containing protein [Rhodocyclaceae bacterium]
MKSPCINICRIDNASGLCEGCLRTLDEIRVWGQADDGERLRILDRVAERARTVPQTACAAGGRA